MVNHMFTELEELDVRPKQVLVEATILQAAMEEKNALGVDFNVLAATGPNTEQGELKHHAGGPQGTMAHDSECPRHWPIFEACVPLARWRESARSR